MNHILMTLLLPALTAGAALAQVHYYEDGRPWSQKAGSGPDKNVPGWFYNLGITGIRVELIEDAPTHLVVRHVFDDSPAKNRVKVGDHIIGAGRKTFNTPHQNGYGMKVFGPEGPIFDFANALEKSFKKGKLEIRIERNSKPIKVTLKVGTEHDNYSSTYPAKCAKTDRILSELLDYLKKQQRQDGSWGTAPINLFAPLALLASGDNRYDQALKKAARFHAKTTTAKDHGSLINWRYCAAGIFLAEYYQATKKSWLLDEMQEVNDFLMHSQYTNLSQVSPEVKTSHPDALPTKQEQQYGGWGHNPGFEGYGPIAMITGQAALALALMKHCGVDVEKERHEAAYDFLARGTGKNGYVWYGDSVAGHADYADMGRTGAAGIACWLSPWKGPYKKRAKKHAACIGEHPESFPDTHGSPTMGMVFAALAANADQSMFRSMMNYNRWWFTLSRCTDGTFYYQPNRDNAGYGGESRLSASAVTALIFSIPKQSLHLTGKPFSK
jgi:hypothetical protein